MMNEFKTKNPEIYAELLKIILNNYKILVFFLRLY